VLAINLSEPPERVRAYVAESRLTLPVAIDTTGEVARAYGVQFTPTHFLIDRAGIVRAGGAGARDWTGPAARAAVQLLLASPARPDRATPPPPGRTERR
jgi:peroxiredoxin